VGSLAGAVVTVALAVGGIGVWAFAAGEWVRTVLVLALALMVLPERVRPRWHAEEAARLWRFARGALANLALVQLLQTIDYVLVGALLGPIALGIYTLAMRAASTAYMSIALVLGDVTFPGYARLLPDMVAVRGAFRFSIRVGCSAAFLLGGGMVALAPGLHVLGGRWAPAVPSVRILGVYVCLRSAAHLVTPLLQAIGRPGVVATLNALWTGLLAVFIVTLGRGGVELVAVAQLVVATILLALHVAVAWRLAGLDVADFVVDVTRPALAAVVAVAVTQLLRTLGGPHLPSASWAALGLLAVVFVATDVVSAVLLDRRLPVDVRRMFRRRDDAIAPRPVPNTAHAAGDGVPGRFSAR
jgi:PST family polysaccharide transporter